MIWRILNLVTKIPETGVLVTSFSRKVVTTTLTSMA
jgi:hypothetical protein